jgi:hypothetical protein
MRADPRGEARNPMGYPGRVPRVPMSTHRALVATLAALSAACGPQPGSHDRELYLSALEASTPSEGLDRCRAIEQPTLKGDCITALLPALTGLPALDSAELCREIDAPTLRDECFFAAAEKAKDEGDLAGAAALCRLAGDFERDCSNHLWQGELRDAIHPGGIHTLVDEHERVRVVHARWREAFGLDEEYDKRFWEHCYQVAFERVELLDPALCERVPEREACLDAVRTTYRAWLNDALRAQGARRQLCGWDVGSLRPSQLLADHHAAVDHSVLVEVLVEVHSLHCPQGPPWRGGG